MIPVEGHAQSNRPLERHKRMHRYFTRTRGSCISQVEIWFSLTPPGRPLASRLLEPLLLFDNSSSPSLTLATSSAAAFSCQA